MNIINKDFRFPAKHERHSRLRWLLFAVGSAVLGVVIANTGSTEDDPGALPSFTEASKSPEVMARQSFNLSLPELQAQQEIFDEINNQAPKQWREFTVKSGDSLAKLFKRADIKPQQLDEMMKSGPTVKQLKRIFPKDTIRVLTDNEGVLQGLRYETGPDSYLLVKRIDGKLKASELKHDIETRIAHASGEIDSSLFLAAEEAGISQNIIMELANIFAWDVDFALDIRKGDNFTVVYEELYRDGEKIANGNILTAEFTNNGKTYQAVRYTNPQTNQSEYFTPEGKSMRKAFLRTPVDFTRISSRFTTSRYHPVLHKVRSHKGVDYAAKRGTPIRAAGDGKVIFKGRKGGYGRVIILQHGTKYSTLYAHLNSYNKKLRIGSKVKQGQTVAYVGSSGLATGPHLHYEFRLNGVHRNPLTVKLPISTPVPARYRADFELMTAPKLAQLSLLTRTHLALNNQ
jgi:murein DD-endopeptidase MepM/ murein hydrolase activator NlpD